jgi:hypothetical protein
MLYAEMFEVAGYFTVVGDGCYNGHVAFTMLTLSLHHPAHAAWH